MNVHDDREPIDLDTADLRALATIDPAGPRDPQAHAGNDAQALLASITGGAAAPVTPGNPGGADGRDATVTSLDTRRRRRWPWIAAAVAVLAGGLIVVPGFIGSGNAYADWTDVPAAPEADDAAAAATECRQTWADSADGAAEYGMPSPATVRAADLVLAEQRGSFTYTVLSDGQWAMDCLVQTRSTWPWTGGGGGAGSLQNLDDSVEPAPQGVSAISSGAFGGSHVEGLVLMMYGRVGPDVTAVVAEVPGVGDVAATLTDGYFAAWAPGLTEAGWDQGVGLTLHLSDGTTRHLTPDDVIEASTSSRD